MLTSVVIPCHDGADDTRACLAALQEQRDAGAIEVVLVDNGSRDAAALTAAALAFAGARVLRLPTNLGFAGGVNRGLAAARGEVLVVLNNDTLPAPSMLARLLRARHVQPRPSMLAPVSNFVKGAALLAVGDRGRDAAGRAAIEAELSEHCDGLVQDVDALAGLCLMFDRKLLDRFGGFDERFGLGNFEDDDLSLRIRLGGGRLVVVRDAFVHHHGSRTFTALGVDYHALLVRNQEVMARKWADEAAHSALQAALAGDLATARGLAEVALRRHPAWPEGRLLVAQAALAAGDAGAALAAAQAYLATCPNGWNANVVQVAARLALGDLAQAVVDVQVALRRCHATPRCAADLLAHLAASCAERGEVAAAIPAMQASLELAPDDQRALWLGRILLARGDLAQAEAALASAGARDHAPSLAALGVCQWRRGRAGAALQTLMRAMQHAPHDAEARANLATALAALAGAGVDVERAQALLAASA